MCGIVGAIAQRDVAEILLEGLRRLVGSEMCIRDRYCSHSLGDAR